MVRFELADPRDAALLVECLLERADREAASPVGHHSKVSRWRGLADRIGDALDEAVPAPSDPAGWARTA